MSDWFFIENESEYQKAMERFQEIKYAEKGSMEYREKMLLAHLIDRYEDKTSSLPELDPIEFIKIRMEDFGYKATDLARAYGDKGTVSKVLNYKQPLSLTMIRKFSEILHIPVEALIKEYKLQS
ncbi:HTH-type transcriptional regulator / antitoxin HigA [Hydrobacter penzbergensis]|jgi:HTH-type transcriptional regulator/antitoxin HigA|uniref:HTH-type transcriptional regulator / antitoxin HigA n=1 Tax=Hydrobacter penzbergensis TaxID=1235997 RepID=A0A8X8IIW1_9BACT|nr:XRE family transcriptional regulator [Hydrobacter penzbergensis]MBN8719525.1 transcriptional regulator [Sediminibacterium magnilacihabitans]PQV60469.1 HTH-type transcriptional regulator/antitoxin HigA [Sediminibacterium magnilacihabitans]SDX57873.1 HTH-type transcriptional regulator / antitoxin HigA [Hydrobacter penzbergensis]